MFLMGRHTHWQMVGMPMDGWMLAGMAAIPLGVLFAGYGLMPRMAQMRKTLQGGGRVHFHLVDDVALNREHWKLVAVLVVALAVDVMKPATLGFVVPGMSREYDITKPTARPARAGGLDRNHRRFGAVGRIGDLFGRRSAILLSALMFMGTAICGAMPSFGWNLAMCFLMGASAGGLLPVAFTLMAETVPAAHRGWLLVALGGIGTSAGYLLAAGAAATLEPMFSWRVLWLRPAHRRADRVPQPLHPRIAALPVRRGPAGPGAHGAAAVRGAGGSRRQRPSRRAGDRRSASGARPARAAAWSPRAHQPGPAGVRDGVGLANFGFLLWLPVNLSQLGVDPKLASALLAKGAVYALPGIAVVVWLYQRWSSVKSLVLFIGLSVVAARVRGDRLDATAFAGDHRRRGFGVAGRHQRRDRDADPVRGRNLSGAPAAPAPASSPPAQGRRHPRRGARRGRVLRALRAFGIADRAEHGGRGGDAAARGHRDPRPAASRTSNGGWRSEPPPFADSFPDRHARHVVIHQPLHFRRIDVGEPDHDFVLPGKISSAPFMPSAPPPWPKPDTPRCRRP